MRECDLCDISTKSPYGWDSVLVLIQDMRYPIRISKGLCLYHLSHHHGPSLDAVKVRFHFSHLDECNLC